MHTLTHPPRAPRLLVLLALVAPMLLPRLSSSATPLIASRVAQGLSLPLYVTAPPGDTARVFIVEQRGADNRGRIKILKGGTVLPTPFLTTEPLANGNEQGLLGLAFAPDYAASGRFYINYTDAGGTTRIVRHTVSANPDIANATGTTILSIPQPFVNHNGGWLGFGPDGYLYIATGDGGGGGDPGDRAQSLNSLLGKILRIDVSGATYAIPPGNPFAGATPDLDEIWSYGLRNPWRCSFDRLTGDLTIGDVGEMAWEEVNFAPAVGGVAGAGVNYGWRCFEGEHPFDASTSNPCMTCIHPSCPMVFPALEYPHTGSVCAVTGGYVYRGCAIPDLQGQYFFADYCTGEISSGRFVGDSLVSVVNRTAELDPAGGVDLGLITSFGEDARGELYLCDQDGEIYKIVPAAPVAEATLPVLKIESAIGDSLGSTTKGNALLTGITAFQDAGSRIRGVGYLRDAALRDCPAIAGNCLTSRLRSGAFDIDLSACVDPATATLTRRFTIVNTSGQLQPLAFVDVIAPSLRGDPDGATTVGTGGPFTSPYLIQSDSSVPDRWIVHSGYGSAGAQVTADVDTASQVIARVAADEPLPGGRSAGPAFVAMALGFDFGTVPPASPETVVVVSRLQTSGPTDVGEDLMVQPARVDFRIVGATPFRSDLSLEIALPRAERVQVRIFDVAGRRIRSLWDGELPAGRRRLPWDGTLEDGAPAPSGVYWIRLESARSSVTRRAVLAR